MTRRQSALVVAASLVALTFLTLTAALDRLFVRPELDGASL